MVAQGSRCWLGGPLAAACPDVRVSGDVRTTAEVSRVASGAQRLSLRGSETVKSERTGSCLGDAGRAVRIIMVKWLQCQSCSSPCLSYGCSTCSHQQSIHSIDRRCQYPVCNDGSARCCAFLKKFLSWRQIQHLHKWSMTMVAAWLVNINDLDTQSTVSFIYLT
jgi:hypothetical protein